MAVLDRSIEGDKDVLEKHITDYAMVSAHISRYHTYTAHII